MVNVLCLCGYTQSASIFRARLSAIRKGCSSTVNFTFLDPPHLVHAVNLPDSSLVEYDSTSNATSEEERPRAWWFAKDDPAVPGGKRYEGLQDTWQLLKETLEKEKFDVVLGFSQGAALAGALASKLHLQNNDIQHPPFRLAILVSGLYAAASLAAQIYNLETDRMGSLSAMQDPIGSFFPPKNGKSPAETLHIIGRGDTIVSMERCQSLVDKFDNPHVELHDGGHFVPSKANFRKYFKALFDALEASRQEGEEEAWRQVQPPSMSCSAATTPNSSRPATPGKL